MNLLAYVKTMFLRQQDMFKNKRKSCILKKGVLTVLEYFISYLIIYSIIVYKKISKKLSFEKVTYNLNAIQVCNRRQTVAHLKIYRTLCCFY